MQAQAQVVVFNVVWALRKLPAPIASSLSREFGRTYKDSSSILRAAALLLGSGVIFRHLPHSPGLRRVGVQLQSAPMTRKTRGSVVHPLLPLERQEWVHSLTSCFTDRGTAL